jgi:hypothetical protein
MSVGAVVGVWMIIVGIFLFGLVIWRSAAYRKAKENLDTHLSE